MRHWLFAAVLSAVSLPLLYAQDERVLNRRNLRFRVGIDETVGRATVQTLWVRAGDGGWEADPNARWTRDGSEFIVEWTAPADGLYSLFAQYGDEVSNRSEAPAADTPPDVVVRIDTAPPTVEPLVSAEVPQDDSSFRFYYEAADSVEEWLEMRMTSSEPWRRVTAAQGRDGNGAYLQFVAPGPGRYHLIVRARDAAGNVGPADDAAIHGRPPHVVLTVGQDTTPPVVRVATPPEVTQHEPALRIDFSVDDPDASAALYVADSGRQWLMVPEGPMQDHRGWYFSFTAPRHGVYHLMVQAWDAAGNAAIAEPRAHVILTIPHPPVVRWAGDPEVTAAQGSVRARYDAQFAEGETPRVHVRREGGPWMPVPGTPGADERGPYVDFVLVAPGRYEVDITMGEREPDESMAMVVVPGPGVQPVDPSWDLEWVSPMAGETLHVGDSVMLRWRTMRPGREVVIEERRDAGEWRPILAETERYGMHLWSVSGPPTESLEFRVRAGEDASPASGPVAVRSRMQPRIASAAQAYESGLVQFHRGEFGAAAVHFRRALDLWPDHAGSAMHLGLSYLRMNEPGVALEYFRAARDLCPSDAQAYYHVALALAHMSQGREAVAELESAADVGGAWDDDFTAKMLELAGALARRCDEAGDTEVAARACRLFLRLPPLDVPGRRWIEQYASSHP